MTDQQDFIPSGKERSKQFDSVFRQLHPGLCLFAESIVGVEDVAEGLVNDCFASYWQKGYLLENRNEAKALLITMIRNACFKYLNKQMLHKKYEKETLYLQAPFESQETDTVDIVAQMHKVIYDMPEQRQKVFWLLHREQLSRDEVAARLKISPHTVKNHYAAAMLQLRKIFSERELMIILLFISLECLKN